MIRRTVLAVVAAAGVAAFVAYVELPSPLELSAVVAGALVAGLVAGRFVPPAAVVWCTLVGAVLVPAAWIAGFVVYDAAVDEWPVAVGVFGLVTLALPLAIGAFALTAFVLDVAVPKRSAVAFAALVLLGTGVGSAAYAPVPDARFGRIDERTGAYGTVHVGDSAEKVRRVFGEPTGFDGGAQPTGVSSYRGPVSIDAPRNAGPSLVLRYPDAAFVLYHDRVRELHVVGAGARASRGVAIGDDLDAVRDEYPELRCGRANVGTEYERYEFCTGRVAGGNWVWFGGDPVDWITVAPVRIGD